MVKRAWRLKYVEGIFVTHIALGAEEFLDLRRFLPGSNDFKKGDLIEGQYAEGIMLLQEVCENVTPMRFKSISGNYLNEWARATHPNGITRSEAFTIMQGYYPDLTLGTRMSVIRLRFPRINDRPTVMPLATSS